MHIQVLIVAELQLFQVRRAAKLSLTVFFTQPWFHTIAYPKLSHLKPIPFGMKKKWRSLTTSIFLYITPVDLLYSHALILFMSWTTATKKKKQKNAFLLSMYILIADLSINLTSYIVLFHSNIHPYLNIIQSIFSTNLFKIVFY